MKKFFILLSLFAVLCVIAVQAQTDTPKPAPEWTQWQGVLGNWTYTCDYLATSLGPASRATGEYNNQMILGGFFMKGQWKEKGPKEELEGTEIVRYDPEKKDFVISGYISGGATYLETATLNGTTEKVEGKFIFAGKEYPARATIIWTNDWASADWKEEISIDGKPWVSYFEQKMTKVKTTAKN